MRPVCGTQISVRTHDMKRIPQMNTRIFTTGALACAVFLAGAAQAAEQAVLHADNLEALGRALTNGNHLDKVRSCLFLYYIVQS